MYNVYSLRPDSYVYVCNGKMRQLVSRYNIEKVKKMVVSNFHCVVCERVRVRVWVREHRRGRRI